MFVLPYHVSHLIVWFSVLLGGKMGTCALDLIHGQLIVLGHQL